MLRLSRRKDERIVIQVGDELIYLQVFNISTNKKEVQLGIDAPAHIKVWRSEIYDAILENQKATESTVEPNRLRDLLKP